VRQEGTPGIISRHFTDATVFLLSVYVYGTAKDRGVFRLEIGREQETNDQDKAS
jgi:hypothetical protein